MKNVEYLGPFVGHTTETTSKIWMFSEYHLDLFISLHEESISIPVVNQITFTKDRLFTGITTFTDLKPNTKYQYKIWKDLNCSIPLELYGLNESDLKFRTLPQEWEPTKYRYDFLLLSCNNPDKSVDPKTQKDGYEVWGQLPAIIQNSTDNTKDHHVLFAIMGGDQVYADDWKGRLLTAKSTEDRVLIYIEIYKHFWCDLRYRKVLAGLPSYLMWDDHDIMDGWGSEISSFKRDIKNNLTSEFKEEWNEMFLSAKSAFKEFQVSRNPERNSITIGFDCFFRVGPLGFFMADLRSHRNIVEQRFWTKEQFNQLKHWIDENKKTMEVLFFVSPVVFAHGAPKIESGVLKHWPSILKFLGFSLGLHQKLPLLVLLSKIAVVVGLFSFYVFEPHLFVLSCFAIPLLIFLIGKSVSIKGLQKTITSLKDNKLYKGLSLIGLYFASIFIPKMALTKFDKNFGDLSDDIKDSWGGEGNEEMTDEILDYFFDLQNEKSDLYRVQVVILSGDIHTGGYSNIYSSKKIHEGRPTIPHIVSSPVGYSPFPWIGEAFYRKFSPGAVPLGAKGVFTAQISHHYTERNVVICSVRKMDQDTLILKTKFYLEGFPEPQVTIFDLEKNTHLEDIQWLSAASAFNPDTAEKNKTGTKLWKQPDFKNFE